MTNLQPFDKMPFLNTAVVLLVGQEEKCVKKIVDAMLKAPKNFEVQIHVAPRLPLPKENEHLRPRIDMVVFIINFFSQPTLSELLSSLSKLDSHFFLGKVCFLEVRGGHVNQYGPKKITVQKMAETYQSPLLFLSPDCEEDVACVAHRLLHMLQICAGLVSGVSALDMVSVVKSPVF
ncbi:centromere protein M-like [Pelobates fuscus]|uniref:centromere protein M-like n=1 Tax=Pelobates fuscus TaxID=191477 RepID=UPI002FE44BDC